MTEPQELTHDLADDVLGAVRRGRLGAADAAALFVVYDIGPALELAFALAEDARDGLGRPEWAAGPSLSGLMRALAKNRDVWVDAGTRRCGFYRTREAPGTRHEDLHASFLLRAQLAAEASGFPKRTAQALVGAIGEIEDNIFEHSGAHRTGIVAFQAGPRVFSFVVGDAGMGVLASLRQSPRFAALDDHGTAIGLALTDGVSRFGDVDPLRGRGFRELFVGLASLRGRLRFASGDHALVIEGDQLALPAARLIQKPPAPGFVVSVTCGL